MKKSIFSEIFFGYFLIIFILSGSILLFTFNTIRTFYLNSLTNHLRIDCITLNHLILDMLNEERIEDIDPFIKNLSKEINTRITVIDPVGIVLADSEKDPKTMENHINRPEVQEALATLTYGSSLRFSDTLKKEMLYVAIPVLSHENELLSYLRLSLFVTEINSLFGDLKTRILLISLVIAVLSLLGAVFYSRSLSKPIKELAVAAHTIGQGNFDVMVNLHREDELKKLSDSFNYMTSHIKDLFTERKQVEDALYESESVLRSFYDSAPMIMGIFEIHGNDLKHISYNAAAAMYAGQNHDSMKNRFASSMGVSDKVIMKWIKHLKKSEEFNKPVNFEYTQPLGHEKRWLHATVSFISEENGIPRFSYIVQDITRRKIMEDEVKKAYDDLELRVEERTKELKITNAQLHTEIDKRKTTEEALRDSESRLRSIIENTPDSIMTVDRTGKIVFSAKAPLNIKNRSYIGIDSFNLISSDYHDIYKNALESVFEKGNFDSFHHTTNDGSWWTTRCVPIINNGKSETALIIATDITDMKKAEDDKAKLEEQLFQAQKMESIGRLAGGIAHDFNNLLVGIMGYSDILRLKFHDTKSPERKAAEIIFKSADKAKDLTQQLLGFARSGKYNPIALNINVVLTEVVKVSEKIFEKSIDVEFNLDSGLKTIEADRNQMDQVLTNIIINARDAMPNGGKIIVKTENIFVDEIYSKKDPEILPGNYVKISITDSGIGMTKEQLTHIFEPFYTTKEKGKGTGLGLAMVYGIIKNHKGFVNCYSEPGEGTTFNLYFPITDKRITEESPEETLVSGDDTILVVDDEQIVRDLAREQLELMGYNVHLARDGIEAIEMYKRNANIDLVLMDMIMPRMAGKETFVELKKINPEVRVVLLSGYSQNGKAEEILKEGAITFLQKPFSQIELSKVLTDVLSD